MSTQRDLRQSRDASVHEGEFRKALGLFDSVMVVAGIMVSSGIFIVSAEISREVGSVGWLLVAWLITGLLTVAGALSYGELAAMMPEAGGMYVYSRESLSPVIAFLYGWIPAYGFRYGVGEVNGLFAFQVPHQNLIGFRWRRGCLSSKQRQQLLSRHLRAPHRSALRSDGAAEGVAHGGPSVLRAGESRGCNLRIRRRFSTRHVNFHDNCSPVGCRLCGGVA